MASSVTKLISRLTGHHSPATSAIGIRPSSAPLISGDTFRALADFVIEHSPSNAQIRALPPAQGFHIIFVKVDVFRPSKVNHQFLRWLARGNFSYGNGPQVVIHNGDLPPTDRYIDELVRRGARVYSVNKVHTSPHLTPIPIGIENFHHGRNEIFEDFSKRQYLEDPQVQRATKDVEIFSSFSVSTNPTLRSGLVDDIGVSRHSFTGSSLTPQDFRAMIRRSMFVLSPPGNGIDCHRTWESLYLGAVPIVLTGTLARSLTTVLPIWEVSDWAEALYASTEELIVKFKELRGRGSRLAYFPYWEELLDSRRTEIGHER